MKTYDYNFYLGESDLLEYDVLDFDELTLEYDVLDLYELSLGHDELVL